MRVPVPTSVALKHELPGGKGGPLMQGVKQGLQVGTGEARLRWERPKVQRMVSGGRVARRRMMIKEGRRIREEVSMVALSWE